MTLPIIADDNHPLLIAAGAKGRIARDFSREPFGDAGFAAFDRPLIPRSEWPDRIKLLTQTKSRIPDLCDAMGLKVKNQEQTNYCWANAPTHSLEISRCVQGEEYVELSPASVGAKIKNFHNVGGWGTEALQYLVDHGAVPTSLWPANAIDQKYDTPTADTERSKYRVSEWWDLEPNNFDMLMTAVLLGFPCAIGLGWWSHEVTAVAGVDLGGGKFGMLIDNSWGTDWGEYGRAVLSEAKATPDDAVCPRSAVGS